MIDSHCHIDFPEFDATRETIWQTCVARGVQALIIPGVQAEQWPRIHALCQQQAQWFYAVGWHPWYLSAHMSLEALAIELRQAAMLPGCVAIGECGLDALKGPSLDFQLAVLACHLELANELQLPLMLHCVKAHQPLMALLKQHPPQAGAVVHGFSGSAELAQQWWAMGVHLGIGGVASFARASKTREAIRRLPAEAFLLETDAPAMLPSWGHGVELFNSPTQLPAIAACVAELRQQPVAELIEQCSQNTRRLFKI